MTGRFAEKHHEVALIADPAVSLWWKRQKVLPFVFVALVLDGNEFLKISIRCAHPADGVVVPKQRL